MQHFEPLFRDESDDPALAEVDARASYRLGLRMIANSSWLRARVLEDVPGAETHLCPNAIDHRVFHGEPRVARRSDEVVVLSYGGRNAAWKGFKEMAEAVRRVRERLPRTRLRWQVYGEALLPPDNAIAPYEHLGFLQPGPLAEAYRRADILLSASWYESFPLFPIEAMACGLPAITTAFGTEEYAVPGETAEVVRPRDPESIAAGLERLVVDLDHRTALAARGHAMARRFTWDRSVETLERILLAPDAAGARPG
jgi:glycosyltransferase involved in cell wall biosynthesis